MPETNLLEDYSHESKVAEALGVQILTLHTWSARRKGPGGRIKVGRKIYYRKTAVQAWLKSLEQRAV